MKIKSASKSEPATPPDELGREKLPPNSHPSPRFKELLVPIDFSDCSLGALDYALAFGEKFGTRITLLHVVEPAIFSENYLVTPGTLDETNQNLVAAGRERLAPLQGRVSGRGLPVALLVRMGRAQSEITDTAKAIGADLIVMGTQGYSGLKHVLLGSTAERVVRQASCPVLTVRSHRP